MSKRQAPDEPEQADPVWKSEPRAILLATDLSSRCDRALDRALALAGQWDARLVALTVIEPAHHVLAGLPVADAGMAASRQLRRDIAAADAAVPVEVLVREGDVADAILAVAATHGCSMIITGTARSEPFGRIVLGSTVEQLARSSELPVLVVRGRMHGDYSRIVVASDFSSSSRRALAVVRSLLPQAPTTLFHAFDVPFLGLMDTQRETAIEHSRAAAASAAADFLEEAGDAKLPVVVSQGDPAEQLREHAVTSEVDLVATATHGRSAIHTILIGSAAERILALVPCDTLLVPDSRARR